MILNDKTLDKYIPRFTIWVIGLLMGITWVTLQENKQLDMAETQIKILKHELAKQLIGNIGVKGRYSTIHNILQCESGYRHEGLVGDLDYPYQAYGMAQYQLRTFMMLAEEVGLENPDIWNAEQQLTLLNHALNTGRGDLWTCYRKLYG